MSDPSERWKQAWAVATGVVGAVGWVIARLMPLAASEWFAKWWLGVRIETPENRETVKERTFVVSGTFRHKPKGRLVIYTRIDHARDYYSHGTALPGPKNRWKGQASVELDWPHTVSILLVEFPPELTFIEDYYWRVFEASGPPKKPVGFHFDDFPKVVRVHDMIVVKTPGCP